MIENAWLDNIAGPSHCAPRRIDGVRSADIFLKLTDGLCVCPR